MTKTLTRRLLFETKLGDKLLAAFERLTGLAVVEMEDIEMLAKLTMKRLARPEDTNEP